MRGRGILFTLIFTTEFSISERQYVGGEAAVGGGGGERGKDAYFFPIFSKEYL